MTKPPVKSYDPQFKQQAVKLAVESASQAQVARDLGISKNTLYSWIRQYHGEPSTPAAQVNEEHLYEELKRLRQENKRLKEERDILKKAVACFAVHPL